MSVDTGTLYWLPRILSRTDLDAEATLLLVGLADHVDGEDRCYVGIQRLANYGRCSYGTARRRLKAIADAGLIERTQLRRDDGGQSVYSYRLVRGALDLAPPAQPARTPPARQVRGAPRAPGSADPPAHLDARAELPLVEPPRKEPPRDAFEEFWAIYPAKVGKGAARTSWAKAIKKATPDQIIAAVGRYRRSRTVGRGFVANPATWLNQERWDDDHALDQPRLAQSTLSLVEWAGSGQKAIGG